MIMLAGDDNTGSHFIKLILVTITIAIYITQRIHIPSTKVYLVTAFVELGSHPVMFLLLFLLSTYAASARCMLGHPRAKTFRQTAHDVNNHTLAWMWRLFLFFSVFLSTVF
jgi:hypothetical protein